MVQLNIAHKIFSVAVVVLILMMGVAFFSASLTEEISDELDTVAHKQLPLSETIGLINVDVLEHGLLLQELFNAPERAPKMLKRIHELNAEIEASFTKANSLFDGIEHTQFSSPVVLELHEALRRVEKEYRDLELHAETLIDLHDKGHDAQFHEALIVFDEEESHLDAEVADLRKRIERMADEAVVRADADEKLLLILSVVLTCLAVFMGVGFAWTITNLLVKNVRNLVSAAEAVESGDLDVEVPVVTRDEVGRLTASFNEMVGGLRMKERIKDTFGKYMDPRLVSRLLDNPELTQLGGERHEMTVMFIDLQGYTTISEKLPPADLVRMLNMFLGHMTDVISQKHGVVNDFMGDAVMAYWGPPFTGEGEHATLACEAALMTFEKFEQFKTEVAQELGEKAEGLDLNMRIGISTGDVISGNIGSASTRKFSVIGDPVNLGARLEGANKNYGTRIMVSERTYELASKDLHMRELDLIRVKGKAEPSRVYQLVRNGLMRGDMDDALQAYREQDWAQARSLFQAHIEQYPDDQAPRAFLKRIDTLEASPPGEGWDGVWAFQTK